MVSIEQTLTSLHLSQKLGTPLVDPMVPVDEDQGGRRWARVTRPPVDQRLHIQMRSKLKQRTTEDLRVQ